MANEQKSSVSLSVIFVDGFVSSKLETREHLFYIGRLGGGYRWEQCASCASGFSVPSVSNEACCVGRANSCQAAILHVFYMPMTCNSRCLTQLTQLTHPELWTSQRQLSWPMINCRTIWAMYSWQWRTSAGHDLFHCGDRHRHWLTTLILLDYPLVNVYITTENHHF